MKSGFFIFFICCVSLAAGQEDSLVVMGKNFKFRDGVYLTFSDFKINQPSYSWDELQATVFSNPKTFMAQVAGIQLAEKTGLQDENTIDLQQIWGICLSGIPYIRLPEGSVKKQLTNFAALRVRGRICYFSFEDFTNRKVPMPVYNPATGRPYQIAYVEREEKLVREKILDFDSGEVQDFTVSNFKNWIRDDAKLLKTLEELSPEEAKEKLFKCLLIYIDRNEVFIAP